MPKQTEQEKLLTEIRAFGAEFGLAPTVVIDRAGLSKALHSKLLRGGGMNFETPIRLRDYMATEREKKRRQQKQPA